MKWDPGGFPCVLRLSVRWHMPDQAAFIRVVGQQTRHVAQDHERLGAQRSGQQGCGAVPVHVQRLSLGSQGKRRDEYSTVLARRGATKQSPPYSYAGIAHSHLRCNLSLRSRCCANAGVTLRVRNDKGPVSPRGAQRRRDCHTSFATTSLSAQRPRHLPRWGAPCCCTPDSLPRQ